MTTRTTPPVWASRLVALIVPSRDREFLIDDLDHEYQIRRARGRRALIWYLAQAVHAAITRRVPIAALSASHSTAGGSMGAGVWTDVQSAWRSSRRQPGVTTAIVLSLGLGLGAATAIFSVVRAVLLAPLPYEQPDRLVAVWSQWNASDRTWVASIDVRDVGARSHLIDGIAMWTFDRVTMTGTREATSLNAGIVTANTFAVLGASPLYGRVFTQAEALAATRSGRTMFAVLSFHLWRSTFAGDPSVIGQTITIDDSPVIVLGVMPDRFQLPTDFANAAPTDLWTPIDNDPAMNEGGLSYFGAARLRGGVSLAAFNAELAGLAADFLHGGRHADATRFTLFAQSIDDDVVRSVRPSIRVVAAAALVLFLIGCANAAALLIARAETRRREWATRTALGAGRWRLIRSQLAESALLSLASGALGIALALSVTRTLEAVGPTAIPRVSDVTVDWSVISFLFLLGVLATVLSSLAPAIHAARLNPVEGLKNSGRTASANRGRLRFRAVLVVSQLSFGLLLVTGAGLLGRSLLAMRHLDLGFEPSRVLTARVALPATRFSKPEAVNAYVGALTARLRALPGVRAAGLVRVLPLAQTIGDWPVTVEGFAPPPGVRPVGDWQVATAGALEALDEHLIRGRFFTDDDTAATPVVVLVNEAMARTYWPGRDPVGRRMRFSNEEPLVWGTVVGVVGDVRHNGVTTVVRPKFYLPYAQFVEATGDKPISVGTIVLRADGDPMSQAATLRSTAASIDRSVPVSAVRSMTDVADAALTAPRLTSLVVTAFATVALLLSAVGLFALLTYVVAERTQELAIRLAIGASAVELQRLVLGQGLRLAGLGLAIGLLLSGLATRELTSLLYGIRPWDPATWLTAPAVLLAAAVVASFVPALQAAATEPVRALRQV